MLVRGRRDREALGTILRSERTASRKVAFSASRATVQEGASMPPAGQDGPDGQRLTGTMPAVDPALRADATATPSVDRRTLLAGAAGALAVAGLSESARAAGRAISPAGRSGPRFDLALARRLQRVLNEAVRGPGGHAPGAILHVHSPGLGSFTGVAG